MALLVGMTDSFKRSLVCTVRHKASHTGHTMAPVQSQQA